MWRRLLGAPQRPTISIPLRCLMAVLKLQIFFWLKLSAQILATLTKSHDFTLSLSFVVATTNLTRGASWTFDTDLIASFLGCELLLLSPFICFDHFLFDSFELLFQVWEVKIRWFLTDGRKFYKVMAFCYLNTTMYFFKYSQTRILIRIVSHRLNLLGLDIVFEIHQWKVDDTYCILVVVFWN